MRVVFMGTPEFAQKSLKCLFDESFDIAAVFTGDDKPRGRGMKLSPCPVKELAVSRGVPVYHPADLSAKTVAELKPDIIAVVAFGKILSEDILNVPPLGCINIHGSLLPKYRGAAPIQHAILNGETETGVTSQYMAKQMDAGDIIFTRKTHIGQAETSADLFERLGDMGAELLAETLHAVRQGTAPRVPQNHEEATFAPMLSRSMSPIDWSGSAHQIKRKVRALVPWPVATMEHDGRTVKVFAVETTDKQTAQRPGTVLPGLEVVCGDGTVLIKRLQAPGGKAMDADEYLRGIRGS